LLPFKAFWYALHRGYLFPNSRQYIRLPAAWPIKCEPQTQEDGKHVVHTRDISAGGVSIEIKEVLPPGTRVHLEILVPPLNRTIQADGKVVRSLSALKGGGSIVGIQFERIDPEDRLALKEAVERFSKALKDRKPHKEHWWRQIW